MNVLQMVGLGLIAAFLCVLLRPLHPELALLLSLAAGGLILLALVAETTPAWQLIQNIVNKAQMPDAYTQILMKALGICVLAQLAGDTCRDAGETALSAKIELAGKLAVLALSLPLFEEILTVIHTLLTPAGGY